MNKKIVYIIVIASVILIGIIILKFYVDNNQNNNVQPRIEKQYPQKQDGRDTMKNKRDVYEASEKNENEEYDKTKRSRESIENVAEQLKNRKNQKYQDSISKAAEIANQQKQAEAEKQKPITTNKKRTNRVEKVKEQKAEPVKEPVKEEYQSSGFGVYVSDQNNNSSSNNSTNNKNSKEYFSVILEEDTKIEDNKAVIFILKENVTIDNILFKKNSVVYGKVSEAGSYFDISINAIKNTDNNIYNMNNVFVYNKNYQRGIDYEGNVNRGVKEGSRQAGSSSPNVLQNSSTSGIAAKGVDIAIRAVDRGVNSMVNSNNTVNLYQGYKLFIKKEL